MRKSDVRQWKYIKPLIKSDYILKVIRKTDSELYGYQLDLFRVRSIKIGTKGNEKGLLVVTLAEPSEKS